MAVFAVTLLSASIVVVGTRRRRSVAQHAGLRGVIAGYALLTNAAGQPTTSPALLFTGPTFLHRGGWSWVVGFFRGDRGDRRLLFRVAVGTLAGTSIGAISSLSVSMAVSTLICFTVARDVNDTLCLMVGIYIGGV